MRIEIGLEKIPRNQNMAWACRVAVHLVFIESDE
jgi:hypothetical protein